MIGPEEANAVKGDLAHSPANSIKRAVDVTGPGELVDNLAW
jgi:hypothetical protein